MNTPLSQSETMSAGLRRILRLRLGTVVALLDPGTPPADADEQEERVHSSRKALKEVRALLRLVRGVMPERRRVAANAQARDLARLLSGARDATVMQATAASLGISEQELGLPPVAAAVWDPAVSADLHRQAVALWEAAKEWPLDRAGWSLVSAGLRRTWTQGQEGYLAVCARSDRARSDDEAFHAWRRVAKARMYQERLLVPAWPAVLGPVAAELDLLQELLGDHHDLHVLHVHLGDHQVSGDILARQAALEATALALGARLYGGSARGWERILRASWKAWRREAR